MWDAVAALVAFATSPRSSATNGVALRMNSSESDQLSQSPLAELPRASLIMRLAAIGAVIAGIAGLFAYAGGWLTPHTLSPASMINTFEQVNGLHPGFRRNHAKGVCFSGYFESNGRGVALSKATVSVLAGWRSLDGLRWREASPMSPTHLTQCAAWRFYSSCPGAKSGARV